MLQGRRNSSPCWNVAFITTFSEKNEARHQPSPLFFYLRQVWACYCNPHNHGRQRLKVFRYSRTKIITTRSWESIFREYFSYSTTSSSQNNSRMSSFIEVPQDTPTNFLKLLSRCLRATIYLWKRFANTEKHSLLWWRCFLMSGLRN